jgi:hypothetical protein
MPHSQHTPAGAIHFTFALTPGMPIITVARQQAVASTRR